MFGHILDRLRTYPDELHIQMSVGDTFIDYSLLADLEDAYRAKVFPDMGVEGEEEERYVSELKRRMIALDDKSVYVAVKAFVDTHRTTVIKTLEYLQKEGD